MPSFCRDCPFRSALPAGEVGENAPHREVMGQTIYRKACPECGGRLRDTAVRRLTG